MTASGGKLKDREMWEARGVENSDEASGGDEHGGRRRRDQGEEEREIWGRGEWRRAVKPLEVADMTLDGGELTEIGERCGG